MGAGSSSSLRQSIRCQQHILAGSLIQAVSSLQHSLQHVVVAIALHRRPGALAVSSVTRLRARRRSVALPLRSVLM